MPGYVETGPALEAHDKRDAIVPNPFPNAHTGKTQFLGRCYVCSSSFSRGFL